MTIKYRGIPVEIVETQEMDGGHFNLLVKAVNENHKFFNQSYVGGTGYVSSMTKQIWVRGEDLDCTHEHKTMRGNGMQLIGGDVVDLSREYCDDCGCEVFYTHTQAVLDACDELPL